MEWFGDLIINNVSKETQKALMKAGEMVLRKSKAVVPVDKGALKGSATRKTINGGKTQELSYNTPYAHRVHEAPDGLKWSKGGTGPKYLETPLRENAAAVLKMLNDATGLGLKGG